jgi:hypothetical protein
MKKPKKVARAKPATKPEYFILWNPDSLRPPRKVFIDRAEAERVAILCAPKYNHKIFVAKLVFEAEPERTLTTVVTTQVPAQQTTVVTTQVPAQQTRLD